MSERDEVKVYPEDYGRARDCCLDAVSKPAHYVIRDRDGEELCQVRDIQAHVNSDKHGITASDYSNAVKYLLRAPFKDKELEDLKKARQHIDWLIGRLEERGITRYEVSRAETDHDVTAWRDGINSWPGEVWLSGAGCQSDGGYVD